MRHADYETTIKHLYQALLPVARGVQLEFEKEQGRHAPLWASEAPTADEKAQMVAGEYTFEYH
jgi:hypothetical protein